MDTPKKEQLLKQEINIVADNPPTYDTCAPMQTGLNPRQKYSAPPPRVIQTVIQNVMSLPVGQQSTFVTCPSCQHQIHTRIETQTSTKQHVSAAALLLLGCWLCCCIPYCMDGCMSTNHYCPNCNAFLGRYDG